MSPPLLHGWICVRLGCRKWEERYAAFGIRHGLVAFEDEDEFKASKSLTVDRQKGGFINTTSWSRLCPSAGLCASIHNDYGAEACAVTDGEYASAILLESYDDQGSVVRSVVVGLQDNVSAELWMQYIERARGVSGYIGVCSLLGIKPLNQIMSTFTNISTLTEFLVHAQAQEGSDGHHLTLRGPWAASSGDDKDETTVTLSPDDYRAIAVFLKESDRTTALTISGTGLNDDALATLCARGIDCGSGNLSHIDLSFNRIGDTGISYLAKSIFVTTGIRSLDISRNRIGDVGAMLLCRSFAVTPCLQVIRISSNSLSTAGAEEIADAMARLPSLQEVDISDNPIGDDGAWALAGGLSTRGTRAVSLKMRACCISDAGADTLANAMISASGNRPLQHLDISENNISQNGATALLRAAGTAFPGLCVIKLSRTVQVKALSAACFEAVEIDAEFLQPPPPPPELLRGTPTPLPPSSSDSRARIVLELASVMRNPQREFYEKFELVIADILDVPAQLVCVDEFEGNVITLVVSFGNRNAAIGSDPQIMSLHRARDPRLIELGVLGVHVFPAKSAGAPIPILTVAHRSRADPSVTAERFSVSTKRLTASAVKLLASGPPSMALARLIKPARESGEVPPFC